MKRYCVQWAWNLGFTVSFDFKEYTLEDSRFDRLREAKSLMRRLRKEASEGQEFRVFDTVENKPIYE